MNERETFVHLMLWGKLVTEDLSRIKFCDKLMFKGV